MWRHSEAGTSEGAGKSTILILLLISKTFIDCVLPGVLLVFASFFVFVMELIKLDFPTPGGPESSTAFFCVFGLIWKRKFYRMQAYHERRYAWSLLWLPVLPIRSFFFFGLYFSTQSSVLNKQKIYETKSDTESFSASAF